MDVRENCHTVCFVLQRAEAHAKKRTGSTCLVAENVRQLSDDGLISSLAVGCNRHDVAHCARRNKERGFFAKEISGSFLQQSNPVLE